MSDVQAKRVETEKELVTMEAALKKTLSAASARATGTGDNIGTSVRSYSNVRSN